MISWVFNLKENLFKLELNEKVERTAAKMKLEATVISDILYVFDQGNFAQNVPVATMDCYYQKTRLGENLFYMHIKSLYIRGLHEDSSQKIKCSQVC